MKIVCQKEKWQQNFIRNGFLMRSCELNHSKTELSKINFEDMSTSMDCENELREGDHANHAAV